MPPAGVERAGADFLLLCTTTFHKVADQVEEAVDIPVLHLADVVAAAVRAAGVETVGLIGTKVAMSESFFVDRLAEPRPDGDRPRRAAPRLPQRRDLRGARPRRRAAPHPQPGGLDHRGAVGRRRRWRAARAAPSSSCWSSRPTSSCPSSPARPCTCRPRSTRRSPGLERDDPTPSRASAGGPRRGPRGRWRPPRAAATTASTSDRAPSLLTSSSATGQRDALALVLRGQVPRGDRLPTTGRPRGGPGSRCASPRRRRRAGTSRR